MFLCLIFSVVPGDGCWSPDRVFLVISVTNGIFWYYPPAKSHVTVPPAQSLNYRVLSQSVHKNSCGKTVDNERAG